MCYIQDDDNQDAMSKVETDKRVYFFYQAPYHSNTYYLEAFKANLKVSQYHNGYVGYHPGLAVAALM